MIEDLVADRDTPALDPAGDDAAVVELVDRLHRHAQRQIGGRARRSEGVERREHRRAGMPRGRRPCAGRRRRRGARRSE